MSYKNRERTAAPDLFMAMKSFLRACAAVLLLGSAAFAQAPTAKPDAGLIVTYSAGTATDTASVPNVWLYIPTAQSPTPFLPAGKFTATYRGNIVADLRGDFMFRAELIGALKLEINGSQVLDASGDGKAASAPSKPVRLTKGANALVATFTSHAAGDAMLRLQWSEKGILWEPVPLAMLTHAPGDAELAKADKLRLGRELFLDARCAKCHATPLAGAPELAMDAPSFEGIGARRHFARMADWILDPKKQRASAHMPRIFSGPKAQEDVDAVAAFLASQTGPAAAMPAKADAEALDAGKKLVEVLHCAGCHTLPDAKDEPGKISLTHINFKFPPGQLAAFLKNPGAHYAWTRMPKFNLTDEEAQQVAAHLTSLAPMAKQRGAPTDAAVLARGQQLIQSSGCLNCHGGLKLENKFKAKPLAELAAAKWSDGCLAQQAKENSKSPQFGFSAAEREALQAFAAGDRASLTRHVPVEFAERQARQLNCIACHGQLEGFPTLDKLGGKLKPEWMAAFMAGEVKYKPRHWVEHRMPAFPQRAAALAAGLAQGHGFPPKTPAEPPHDAELAKVGQKLLGTDGGFSCVSCHSVGGQKATQVFESEGINFAYSAERLQKSYYLRWVRNPLRLDPTTKMPVYFDENDGKSPLTEVLGGDSDRQLDALWHFFRLGDKVQPPGAH